MKIHRLETHDRLVQLHKEQALNISQGAEDCLKRNDLSLKLQQYSPYIYLFAHPRTAEDGVTKRMIWQPRLTKPKPQTNSYLFRAESNSDKMEICWLIPAQEMWDQYKKGNVTEHELVIWSIDQFLNNLTELERPYEDDLPEDTVKQIYLKVAAETDQDIRMDKLYEISSK
jgi:hypothetical protein